MSCVIDRDNPLTLCNSMSASGLAIPSPPGPGSGLDSVQGPCLEGSGSGRAWAGLAGAAELGAARAARVAPFGCGARPWAPHMVRGGG